MRSALRWIAILSLCVACSEPEPAVDRTESTSTSWASVSAGWRDRNARNADEDWCVEHEVPESACTRCNPELRAQFQARGDWCEEHELPASQCRQCNPDLRIERPR